MIDTIQKKLIKRGVADARQRLQKIRQKTMKIHKTDLYLETVAVENILRSVEDLNGVEATKTLRIEQLNLQELVENVGQMYTPFLKKHHMDFRSYVTTDLWIKVDKMSFFHIFFNLIYYMVGHVRADEQNRFISIEAKAYNEKLIAIYLEDNGVYLSEETAQALSKSYDSTVLETLAGVGLSLVKEWVAALKGSIQLIDKPGPGMKCCLLLPGR